MAQKSSGVGGKGSREQNWHQTQHCHQHLRQKKDRKLCNGRKSSYKIQVALYQFMATARKQQLPLLREQDRTLAAGLQKAFEECSRSG